MLVPLAGAICWCHLLVPLLVPLLVLLLVPLLVPLPVQVVPILRISRLGMRVAPSKSLQPLCWLLGLLLLLPCALRQSSEEDGARNG